MNRELKIFAVSVILGGAVLAITSVWNDSIIIDEDPHIGAGYSYLTQQDYRLNPEHPPLAKDIAAIPLLFLNLNRDVFKTHFWLTDINGQWEFGRKLIFNSGNDADLIAHAAKLPMILFFLFSAWLAFKWAYDRYGQEASIITLILFSFSPTILAHTRFVTTDVPALFGALYSIYFFVRYLRTPSRKSFCLAAAFFGVALLLKFSTFLLIPLFGLIAMFWGIAHAKKLQEQLKLMISWGLRATAVMATGFVLIVWPVYEFHVWHYPPERQHRDTQTMLSTFGKRYLADPVVWASDKPVLRAAGQYFLGVLLVIQRSAGGNTSYFLGEVSRTGSRAYFPIVYFLKEPLAWWILVLIALCTGILVKNRKSKSAGIRHLIQTHPDELAMLGWIGIYWFFSIRSTLNIGVRHLLPTYPFAMMLVAGQIAYMTQWIHKKSHKYFKHFVVITAVLLGWYVFESVHIWPYYLTYFNQIAGGPTGGYRYVADSNLDWGQDLKRFATWVQEQDIPKIEFDYFGWADPAYYLGNRYLWLSSNKYRDARDFIRRNQSNGWIAVSVSFLQGSIGLVDKPEPINYTWLKSYEPTAVIGNSIFVWHIMK